MKLKDRVAIVTGAARGLGKAFALRLAQEGASVVAVDILDDTDTAREIEAAGGNALALKVDVSSEEETKRMAEQTLSRFGRIDILVNNAAMLYTLRYSPFDELDPAEWDRVMAVNVKGPWLCIKAVIPNMKEQGKGKIINISSLSALTGGPFALHYVVSKGAVISLTRGLAIELGAYNICVNTVAPGFVMTEAAQQLRTEEQSFEHAEAVRCLKRLEHPDDVAGLIAFLASDDSDFITGQTILVDGGQVKL